MTMTSDTRTLSTAGASAFDGSAGPSSLSNWWTRLLGAFDLSGGRPARRGVDAATGFHDIFSLTRHGDVMLAKAQRDRAPLSVILLDFSDLAEVRDIYGRQVARQVLARVVRAIRAVAGRQGVAARTGTGQFTIVLPGTSREKALAAVQRVLGKPSRIEFDAGDSELVLVPEVMIRNAVADTASVEELRLDMERQLLRHREHEARRCEYLQRERERHSQPMGLSYAPVARRGRVAANDPLPATVPARLVR